MTTTTKKVLSKESKTEMTEIVKGLTTTSSKIRALDGAGYPRADIARFLDKRYQHVRNVLVTPLTGSKS